MSEKKSRILLASLDLFWMPDIQKALSSDFEPYLVSTWSLLRKVSNGAPPRFNLWPFHYLLWLYKRFPFLQWGNYLYQILVLSFDCCLRCWSPRNYDVLCVLSGCGLRTLRSFQKHGKRVVIECGSTHTDYQHQILLEEFKRNGIRESLFPQAYRDRVRREFIEADWIQIPSQFVKRTFIEAGIPESKLLLNLYGADTSRFSPRAQDDLDRPFRVICPSGVNLRKGARILVEAWKQLGWKDAELHWIGNAKAPQVRHLFREPLPGLVWHGWMPHEKLAELYRSCDVLVLPSFEEGFARVMVEGAASGLGLIATPNTGVEDFFTPEDPEGWLIPVNDIGALCRALEEAKHDRARTRQLGLRAAKRTRKGFSPEDYGRRAVENLQKVFG